MKTVALKLVLIIFFKGLNHHLNGRNDIMYTIGKKIVYKVKLSFKRAAVTLGKHKKWSGIGDNLG